MVFPVLLWGISVVLAKQLVEVAQIFDPTFQRYLQYGHIG